MKHLLYRYGLLTALCSSAFLLSCDARKDVTASEPGVWVMPRFAEGTTVPKATTRVVGMLSAKGRPDTVRTVPYVYDGSIEFGTLPAQTPFRLTLTGYDSNDKPLWWSWADDTTGSSPVKDVLMKLASVPAAAGSLWSANSTWYKGDTLPVPVGAFYTVDGSDPRTPGSGQPVLDPKGLAVDSSDTIKIAVRVPGDSALGQPELWSPVETRILGIDVLDTITSLDTLILTSKTSLDRPSLDPVEARTYGNVRAGTLLPGSNQRTDTLRGYFGPGPDDSKLRLYGVPTSPRAVILCNGDTIPAAAFPSIPFPQDSILAIQVRNTQGVRNYTIRLTSRASESSIKDIRSFSASADTVMNNNLDQRSWTLLASANRDTISVYPTLLDDATFLRFGDSLVPSGGRILLRIPRDTIFRFVVVDSLQDPKPSDSFSLVVLHTVPEGTFRDTTWGVPWREVSYDTLLDTRNGRKYRTVMVGQSRWMAENLNFRRDSSFCPGMADSCSRYGRWYRWAAAADTTPAFDSTGLATTTPLKGICPSGWHLPSETEWRNLVDLLGTSKSATLLRSVGSSWNQGGGEDSVGFRALPGGYRYLDRGYPSFFNTRGQTSDAYFWTSTQSSLDATRAGSVHISGSAPAVNFVANSPKSHGYNVRCVENAAP